MSSQRSFAAIAHARGRTHLKPSAETSSNGSPSETGASIDDLCKISKPHQHQTESACRRTPSSEALAPSSARTHQD